MEKDNNALVEAPPEMEGLSVVNIKEMKKQHKLENNANKTKSVQSDAPDSIKNWLIAGVAIGLILLLLGFFYSHLFYLAPLGPILSVSVWSVKKIFAKYSKYDDNIFKY